MASQPRRRTAAEWAQQQAAEQQEREYHQQLHIAMNLAVQVADCPSAARKALKGLFEPAVIEDALKRVGEVKAERGDLDWRVWAQNAKPEPSYSLAQQWVATLPPKDFDRWVKAAEKMLDELPPLNSLPSMTPAKRVRALGLRKGISAEVELVKDLRRQIGATREQRLLWHCDENRLPPMCPARQGQHCEGRVLFEAQEMDCPLANTWGCPLFADRHRQELMATEDPFAAATEIEEGVT